MNKPTAVIVDVDGTLVDVRSTRHHVLGPKKDFHAFHADAMHCPPNAEVIDWVQYQYDAGHQIIVVTARKYEWEEGTAAWCLKHIPVDFLGPFMRGDNDNRPDTEIKTEIFNQLSETFELVAAIDDNPKVIALWRELGLKVTEVPGWDDDVAAAYTEMANIRDPK